MNTDVTIAPKDAFLSNEDYSDFTNALTELCFSSSEEAGWWTNINSNDLNVIATKLCLVHSEVSEAMEGVRKDLMDTHLPHRKMVEVELADVLIRVFDLAGALDLDLGGALVEKMVYNKKRPDHKLENRGGEGGKKF